MKNKRGEIQCPNMFTNFTNVYYFTTIVTTSVGYGSQLGVLFNCLFIYSDNKVSFIQYTDTHDGKVFLIFFAIIAIPYTQFMILQMTKVLYALAERLSLYMNEQPLSRLSLKNSLLLAGVFGYFTILTLIVPVIFILNKVEGWNTLTGKCRKSN